MAHNTQSAYVTAWIRSPDLNARVALFKGAIYLNCWDVYNHLLEVHRVARHGLESIPAHIETYPTHCRFDPGDTTPEMLWLPLWVACEQWATVLTDEDYVGRITDAVREHTLPALVSKRSTQHVSSITRRISEPCLRWLQAPESQWHRSATTLVRRPL